MEINPADVVGSMANYFFPSRIQSISTPTIPLSSLNSTDKTKNIPQTIQNNNNNYSNHNLLSNQLIGQIIDQISNTASSQDMSAASKFQFISMPSNFTPNADLLKVFYKYQMYLNIVV